MQLGKANSSSTAGSTAAPTAAAAAAVAGEGSGSGGSGAEALVAGRPASEYPLLPLVSAEGLSVEGPAWLLTDGCAGSRSALSVQSNGGEDVAMTRQARQRAVGSNAAVTLLDSS